MLAETVRGWYDKAEARGEAKGKTKGKAETLIFLLENQFDPLSSNQKEKIFALNEPRLMAAISYIFPAKSLEDMFVFINTLK